MCSKVSDQVCHRKRYLDMVSQEACFVQVYNDGFIQIQYELDEGTALIAIDQWREMLEKQLYKEIL